MYSYTTRKASRSGYNAYFSDGRTYEPLYFYFRPDDYINESGYYSSKYDTIYRDGYGYNFFYDTYGYYEYSIHPKDKAANVGAIIGTVIAVAVLLVIFVLQFKKIKE